MPMLTYTRPSGPTPTVRLLCPLPPGNAASNVTSSGAMLDCPGRYGARYTPSVRAISISPARNATLCG